MAARQVPPLTDILAQIPDPRQLKGRRHPLRAMLTLLCLAVPCGRRNVLAVAERGPPYGEAYASQLGFGKHGYPSTVTCYRVLDRIDVETFEAKLAGWVEQVLGALAEPGVRQGISIDGNALRGSRKQGAEVSHLLTAASHCLSLVLAQVAVDEKTNELGNRALSFDEAFQLYLPVCYNDTVSPYYQLIGERVAANRERFFIFQDTDSAFNHGFPSGIFGDAGKIHNDAGCVNDPTSETGCTTDPNRLDEEHGTVLRVTFEPMDRRQFAGLQFEESEDWSRHRTGRGYDLSGATHLVFDYRSPTPGGVAVEFGLAGYTTPYIAVPYPAFDTGR